MASMHRRTSGSALASQKRGNDGLLNGRRPGDPDGTGGATWAEADSPIAAQAPRQAPPSMAEINAAMRRWR